MTVLILFYNLSKLNDYLDLCDETTHVYELSLIFKAFKAFSIFKLFTLLLN